MSYREIEAGLGLPYSCGQTLFHRNTWRIELQMLNSNILKYLIVCEQIMDIKWELLMLEKRNTWNYLSVCRQMINIK